MKVLVHTIATLILSIILFPWISWNVILIFIGGVLIDSDHYLGYVLKFKKWNLFKCYKFYMESLRTKNYGNVKDFLLIGHTVEFFIAIIALSFFSKPILFFTIGVFFHMMLDLIFIYTVSKKFLISHSILYWTFKYKILKTKI